MTDAPFVDVSDLSNGLYYVELRSGDRKQTAKFIKK
ncbi:T9SS type A sorting domain-containing protein [Flavobacterium caeni]|nr:T9SS type A sorting domain-containing protein [Flavobacterium caeni]